jgi:hypothetical protein
VTDNTRSCLSTPQKEVIATQYTQSFPENATGERVPACCDRVCTDDGVADTPYPSSTHATGEVDNTRAR